MFDIGFSELLAVALVALIVIGPERLPRLARTLGALLGRAQRYVNDVKADIQREVDLDEMKELKSTFQDAAKSVEKSVTQLGQDFQATGESLNQSISGAAQAKAEAAAENHLAAGETPAASPQMDLGLERKPAADETAAAPKA
ncbi:MAG: Sec-independent protein translocase protein TatB [Burkholderiales bacterium]|nr:Sec-independent protein translocase protein TatB [Burkholderiales bacterium]